MNLQENIQRIREMMGMNDSPLKFDIQKLVDEIIDTRTSGLGIDR